MKLKKPLINLRSVLGGCVVGLATGSAQTILHPSEQHFWPALHSLSPLHSFGWSGHGEGLGNTGHTTDPVGGRTPWGWPPGHLVWESFTNESVCESETVNQLSNLIRLRVYLKQSESVTVNELAGWLRSLCLTHLLSHSLTASMTLSVWPSD